MTATRPPLVADPDLVTPEWLTHVLRHAGAIDAATKVASFAATPIGTGQVGANVRYSLSYDRPRRHPGAPGPATVVGKFSSRDETSAAAGVATLTYETEVAFYRDLAHTVDISRPHCHFAELRSGTADVVLVMEDIAPAEPGDQIAGCTVQQAGLAIDEAARLHGPRWGDPTLAELSWLDRGGTVEAMAAAYGAIWEPFTERYRAVLDPVTLAAGPQFAALVPELLADTSSPRTPVHSDYRLDNMLFGTGGVSRPLTVVDWQTVRLGAGPSDVAYFLGSAFEPGRRRSCERGLLVRYHRALVEDYGVDDYPFDQCWRDYVRSSYSSLLMAVFASMLVGRTDRG
ncbi:MAG TPA: phosphotransferase, partial [Streptosporangiaceae bacterium]|nr:phosphotransferase [Streptosporangiaceae bacterium]